MIYRYTIYIHIFFKFKQIYILYNQIIEKYLIYRRRLVI